MALNGQIVFNASNGNDATSSGLGPATPTTGAATTDGTDTVLVGDTTGISVGDLLFVNTASGTAFGEITAFVANTSITCAGKTFTGGDTYAVGGKRATFDNAFSRQLFQDIEAGWDIGTETDQDLSSGVLLVQSAMSNSGLNTVFIRGIGGRRKIRNTGTGNVIQMSTPGLGLSDLHITHSGGGGVGVWVPGGASRAFLHIGSSILGDANEQLTSAVDMEGSNDRIRYVTIAYSTVQECSVYGVDLRGPFSGVSCHIYNSALINNRGWAVQCPASASPVIICNNLIARNGDAGSNGGIRVAASNPNWWAICGNTIVDNQLVGVRVTNGTIDNNACTIANNIFAFNNGNGLELGNMTDQNMADYNNNLFHNNSGNDVTGNLTNLLGRNPIQADPLFIDRPNDYGLQAGSPALNAGATFAPVAGTSYPSIGAIQNEVTAGGGPTGGLITHPGMTGGIRG